MKDKRTFIVSIHTPKTAGTTVASIFDRCFHRSIIYDYEAYNRDLAPNNGIADNAPFIEKYFAVLHGHFYYTTYANVFPDARYVATLRHPVYRVISQYQHELQESGAHAWYHDDILSGRMSVVDFAGQRGIGDAMLIHLRGRELKDYDAVIIAEDLHRSVSVFSHTVRKIDIEGNFGKPVRFPIENGGASRRSRLEIGRHELEAIYGKTSEDNDLYRRAVDILALRIEKILRGRAP